MRSPYCKSIGITVVFSIAVFTTRVSNADINVPNADGSDGTLNVTSANLVIDLSQAPTLATWESDPNPNPNPAVNQGKGIYDPIRWAIVFRLSSVNINAGRTITFLNHPSRAPVVWLVSGTVTINGGIALNGQNGHDGIGPIFVAQPGPGGFRGGLGKQLMVPQSGGYGPGGTRNISNSNFANAASYGTSGGGPNPGSLGPTYGSALVLPLIGGSGGTGYLESVASVMYGGGGAGGGAILIAATQTIAVGSSGTITANGGSGLHFGSGGSGGAIRLVGDQVTGSGNLRALGGGGGSGVGGVGRIRIELSSGTTTLSTVPAASEAIGGSQAVLWPPAGSPTVRVASIDGVVASANPLAAIDFPVSDVLTNNPNPMIVLVECTNVPTNSTVTVRAVLKNGQDVNTTASLLSGDVNSSVWQASVQLPDGYSVIQARAVLP